MMCHKGHVIGWYPDTLDLRDAVTDGKREYSIDNLLDFFEERSFERSRVDSRRYSLLCKWFHIAVLPADKELYDELYPTEDMRRCSVCGAPFAFSSNRAI